MAKQWWQGPDIVKPFVPNYHRDPCDCSQEFQLEVTGMSQKQGPTHYCPGCRWAFWPIEMKPTAEQLTEIKKIDPKATVESMTYIKMRNKPPPGWGSSPETVMIDQLGKGQPFLTQALQRYWTKKYAEKYPNSEIGKAWAQKYKMKDDDN